VELNEDVELRLLDETELIGRARGGSGDAFGELVRRHQAVAFRIAYHVLGDASEAEDAVQEGFVKAYLALDRFREEAAFRPWLLTIVGNEARNRRRSVGRRHRLALRSWDPTAQIAWAPDDEVVSRRLAERVLAAMAGLDEKHRAVLVCRYLLELSEAETSAALGVARGTVKSRTSRALERLRTGYEESP
jgi:RNA polymerase sigma-70 factor (ECF subfamily)